MEPIPVVDAKLVEHDPGRKSPHHVQSTVSKIDNAQQAKDDSQPKAEQGVKRAIDQAQQELTQKSLTRNTENFHEVPSIHGLIHTKKRLAAQATSRSGCQLIF
jgi:hypothetical protein